MGQYLIDFPELTHREAKIRAAQEGITLKELILKAMEEYLRKKVTKK